MNKQSNILFKDLSKGQLILIIEKLSNQVSKLTKELEKYKHPKNSSNSSIPPSKDENRPKRNQSLREKTGRKPGGQKGHPGDTLRMTETPDEIIKLVPKYCNKCGNDLSEIEAKLDSKRQVIEIPPIKPKYIEYQRFSKQCGCGHEQYGEYPEYITNHIQYGPSVEAMAGYYSVYQYLPFNRMKQMFAQVFNCNYSAGKTGI